MSHAHTARHRSEAGSSRRWWLVVGALVAYALAATIALVILQHRIRAFERQTERLEADRIAQALAVKERKSEVAVARREEPRPAAEPREIASFSPRAEEPAAPGAPKEAPGDPESSATSATAGPAARARSLFEKFFAAEKSGEWDSTDDPERELFLLLREEPEAHAALMALLRDTNSDEQIFYLLHFLTRNSPTRFVRDDAVTVGIMAMAWEVVRGTGSARKRAAAAEVLLEYDREETGQRHAGALVEIWDRETDPAIRDALFREVLQRGPFPLPTQGAGAMVRELRSRAQRGDWETGALLSCWSEDPNDFQLLANAVRTVPDGDDRQHLMSALQSNRPITRGRGREARALLVEILEDEKCTLRSMAYGFLRDSWLPWDEATEAAVRRYEARESK